MSQYRAQRFTSSGPINPATLNARSIGVFSSCAEVRSNALTARNNSAIVVRGRGIFVRVLNEAGSDTGDEVTDYIALGDGYAMHFIHVAYTHYTYIGTPPEEPGASYWDGDSFNVQTNFLGVALQLGEENQILVVNDTSGTAVNGAVAYASGAQGQRLATQLFANGTAFAGRVLGLYTHDVEAHQNGRMTNFGLVRDLNTQGMVVGLPVFSDSVLGGLTQTRPSGYVEGVEIGLCVQAHPVNGVIFVRVVVLKRQIGTTANRPTNPREGDWFVDSTLNKPIWWNGSVWIDATGATV